MKSRNNWLIAHARFAARTFAIILATIAFAAVTASAQSYLFERSWPNFNSPQGVAVDAHGNIIVADTGNHCIQVFSSNGAFLRKWGALGSGDGEFNYPSGVVVDASGNIIVADTGNGRIQVFSPNGEVLRKWDADAKGVAADAAGNIIVVFNHGIQVISSNGVSLRKWGTYGSSDGQFNSPHGVAVNAAGTIIVVADTTNNRIQVFTSNGVFLRKWGTEGSGDGQFKGPQGVAVDDAGNIIVADYKNHRIQVFDPNGSFLTKFGSEGAENGFFHHPAGVACDVFGNVYVADYNNHRIQKFIKSGGVPGAATLLSPSGIIGTATPTFTWNAVPFATWYQLWVNDAHATPRIQQWISAEQAGCPSGTGACSVSPSVTLAPGAAQWWIQTWNSTGYGPWSDGMSFSINVGGPPPKASLISPSGTITTSTPTYTWKTVASSTWYLLYVNDSKTQAKINQWYKASDAKCDSATCSVTPATILASGSCQWWVQTWNDAGYGPWSDAMAFVVVSGPPGKATLLSPSAAITTSTPTYSWNAVSGSTWYLLWVNDSVASGKINKWYTVEQAGCGSGTGNCSVKPDTALANGAAQWWVQTYNDSGVGPWSDGMNFTVGGGITGPYRVEFVTVPAGEFQMGSTNGESDERPVHRAIISKSFQLGKYEIKQGQWKAVMGSNPGHFK